VRRFVPGQGKPAARQAEYCGTRRKPLVHWAEQIPKQNGQTRVKHTCHQVRLPAQGLHVAAVENHRYYTQQDAEEVKDTGNPSLQTWRNSVELLHTNNYANQRPRVPNANREVQETVRRQVEDEFFDLEYFSDRGDSLANAHLCQLYFNLVRPNSHKEN